VTHTPFELFTGLVFRHPDLYDHFFHGVVVFTLIRISFALAFIITDAIFLETFELLAISTIDVLRFFIVKSNIQYHHFLPISEAY